MRRHGHRLTNDVAGPDATLRGFGYKVELLKIAVSGIYAKTVAISPKKGMKT